LFPPNLHRFPFLFGPPIFHRAVAKRSFLHPYPELKIQKNTNFNFGPNVAPHPELWLKMRILAKNTNFG